jgi:hypothetical protein
MKGRNGQVSIEDLPPELQDQIRAALGTVPKKQKLGEPLTKGQVLLASSRVMEALRKSKAPPHQWYRILGQCQRWCRNPSRLYGAKKTPR